MTCADVERALIEGFDDATTAERQQAIELHLESCPSCMAVAVAQRSLDAKLSAALLPPMLSSSFRPALRRQITSSESLMTDALPDVLHLSGCALLTGFCVVTLPADTSVIVAAATFVTVASYVILTVMRNTLDESRL
jgi:anti-sigma factor RsiW